MQLFLKDPRRTESKAGLGAGTLVSFCFTHTRVEVERKKSLGGSNEGTEAKATMVSHDPACIDLRCALSMNVIKDLDSFYRLLV